jgi:alginate O-acetyltransferase complex protein AlgI
MLFSSLIFLTLFLPFVLLVYFLLENRFRNLFLLIVSLFFYAWGEPSLVLLMIISIAINFIVGVCLAKAKQSTVQWLPEIVLGLGICINLLLLVYYKYFNFIIHNIQSIGFFPSIDNESIILPLGISFYTFHSISYLMDLYRKEAEVQRNFLDLGLYIAFFPQLIAGPIIRYHDIDKQLTSREVKLENFTQGIIRFIQGLAKKVLIANSMALIADNTFNLPANDLPAWVAWGGILCYSLQIYFDFSGYSDMAIGLAKMFGFNFLENFNYPYISKSIQEFWRRWHISLSSWFRDYVYIPLGGSKKGNFITYRNLLIVFFITGLWHGASWSFIIWGLYHGFFIVIERLGFAKFLEKIPSPLRLFYTLFVVVIGWVFFRSENLSYSVMYLKTMFGFNDGNNYYSTIYYNNYFIFVFILAIILSAPITTYISGIKNKLTTTLNTNIYTVARHTFYLLILVLCFMELAQNSYNPFIYFRF